VLAVVSYNFLKHTDFILNSVLDLLFNSILSLSTYLTHAQIPKFLQGGIFQFENNFRILFSAMGVQQIKEIFFLARTTFHSSRNTVVVGANDIK
jgi:hypothetical protein